jgi:hypothetical protein
MTIEVPTAAEFAALEARVAALEAASPPEPPQPQPPTDGIQAKRIADLVESFGVNTFSSMDTGNVWGSWPADYQPDSVIAGLQFILGDSGFAFRLREYHYRGREGFQRPWLQQVTAALPGTRATLCVAANGTPDDVPSLLGLADDPACNVAWVEGLNEPNTDFGWGNVPVDTTLAIQQAVDAASVRVMGPSIVAGMPNPAGWITGYAGDSLPDIIASMEWGNGHYYPPAAPDVPGTGYSIDEYVGGLGTAYEQHPIALTEFHPTLYAAASLGVKARIMELAGRWRGGELPPIGQFAANPRDPFYTLTTLLRCAKNGTMGLWWYALYDYGETYECGLFPKDHANGPRPAALALQALCAICADRGDRHGFAPGLLDIEVTGLTEAMDYDVYQASDGRYLVPLWYAAADAGQGPIVSVAVRFAAAKRSVGIFSPLDGAAETDRIDNATVLGFDMAPGVTILEVSL